MEGFELWSSAEDRAGAASLLREIHKSRVSHLPEDERQPDEVFSQIISNIWLTDFKIAQYEQSRSGKGKQKLYLVPKRVDDVLESVQCARELIDLFLKEEPRSGELLEKIGRLEQHAIDAFAS